MNIINKIDQYLEERSDPASQGAAAGRKEVYIADLKKQLKNHPPESEEAKKIRRELRNMRESEDVNEADYNPKSNKYHSAADSKSWTPEQHRERAAKHMRSASRLRKDPKYGEKAAKQEEAQARKHERFALAKEGKGKKRAPNRQKGPGRSYSVYD